MSDEKYEYRLFALSASGGYVAARVASENADDSGIRKHIQYPAFVGAVENKLGFKFEAFHYVGRDFTLYTSALLGEAKMPAMMVPFYEKHITVREAELAELPDA